MAQQTKIVKKPRYATMTFRYYDNGDNLPNALRLIQLISEQIGNYNAKGANFGYSRFDIVGFYIDEEEMNIDEQNKVNEEYTTKENLK